MLSEFLIVFMTVFQHFIPFSCEQAPVLNSFSSKTAYRNSDLVEFENGSKDLIGCELVHVNTIYRHGTRYPSKKDINKISEIFTKIIKSVSRNNLPKDFLNWKNPFSVHTEMELSKVGIQEMSELGKRFRVKFDSIIGNGNMLDRIKIFSTSKNRSKSSALHFLESFLMKSKSTKSISEIIRLDDNHLRFFDACPLYTNEVLESATMEREYRQFLKGPQIKAAVSDIQTKWGLQDVPLDGSDLKTLFSMCGYEIATNLSISMIQKPQEQTSPLCSLFSHHHFSILEYLYDLKHYWMKAYGHSISKLIGCKLMTPITKQIVEAARKYEQSGPKLDSAVLWFSHAETILPLIGLLGLFDQKLPMTANGFLQRLKSINHGNRFSVFRTANIVPFSGNLELNLYKCRNDTSNHTDGFYVQVRINEKVVPWPKTDNSSLISLNEFEKRMQICDVKNFHFDTKCQLKNANVDDYLKASLF